MIRSKTNWEDFAARREELLSTELRQLGKSALPTYLRKTRWFGGKAKTISRIMAEDRMHLPVDHQKMLLLVLRIDYLDQPSERYGLFLGFRPDGGPELPKRAIISKAKFDAVRGVLFDAIYSEAFRRVFLQMLFVGSHLESGQTRLQFTAGEKLMGRSAEVAHLSRVLQAEQSNSSIVYGKDYFCKMYRKVEFAINPDVEVSRFLTEQAGYEHVPPWCGSVELIDRQGRSLVMAMVQELVSNRGDAWTHTLLHLGRYYVRLQKEGLLAQIPPQIEGHLPFNQLPDVIRDTVGRDYYERTAQLARRTAGLHKALGSGRQNEAFSAESLQSDEIRRHYLDVHELMISRFNLLRSFRRILKDDIRDVADGILDSEDQINSILKRLHDPNLQTAKIRIHGDYHLGQVLDTGSDFIILDFEGEPDKPHSERRRKYSPLKDVAGMIRSYHYAVHAALQQSEHIEIPHNPFIQEWANCWYQLIAGHYLHVYQNEMKGSELIPDDAVQSRELLQAYILEKAIYELGYELNNRPDWVAIPLTGISHIIKNYAEKSR